MKYFNDEMFFGRDGAALEDMVRTEEAARWARNRAEMAVEYQRLDPEKRAAIDAASAASVPPEPILITFGLNS